MSKIEIKKTDVRYDREKIPTIPEFQKTLSKELDAFLKLKIRNDPIYIGKEIIIDDFKVSGEGEHKILNYLRYISNQQKWDPSTNVWICSR